MLTKNLENTSTTKQIVSSYFNTTFQKSELQFSSAQVSLKNANFSYTELSKWRDKIIKAVFEIDGVLSFDLAEDKNVLLIGILNNALRDQVSATLEGLNTPVGMVVIDVVGKIKSIVGKQKRYDLSSRKNSLINSLTLEDVVRPLSAGTEVQRVTPISGGFPELEYCTIGFNAVIGVKDVFLTNSHCTENGTVWQVNPSSKYHQSGQNSAPGSVGEEIYDPQGSCPFFQGCRYSDAAVIQKTDSVNWDFGIIPKTNGRGTNWTPGSKTIIQPKLEIIDDDINLMVNSPLSKIGKSSGWTVGLVSQTCVTYDWTEGNNIKLICQYAVDGMYAEGGDSGSPVIDATTTNFGEVELAGILWGINGSEEVSYFSHMTGIRADFSSFGALETFVPPLNVNISGPGFIDQSGSYNWSANVQNQDGAVNYQWSIQYDGSPGWTNLGTAINQSVNVTNDTDFTMRVIVTDVSDSDTAFRPVTVNLEDCNPNEPPFDPCGN